MFAPQYCFFSFTFSFIGPKSVTRAEYEWTIVLLYFRLSVFIARLGADKIKAAGMIAQRGRDYYRKGTITGKGLLQERDNYKKWPMTLLSEESFFR